jgi:hypothetical protein
VSHGKRKAKNGCRCGGSAGKHATAGTDLSRVVPAVVRTARHIIWFAAINLFD